MAKLRANNILTIAVQVLVGIIIIIIISSTSSGNRPLPAPKIPPLSPRPNLNCCVVIPVDGRRLSDDYNIILSTLAHVPPQSYTATVDRRRYIVAKYRRFDDPTETRSSSGGVYTATSAAAVADARSVGHTRIPREFGRGRHAHHAVGTTILRKSEKNKLGKSRILHTRSYVNSN